MRAPKTLAAAVALTAITGLSLAACGSSSNSSSGSSSASTGASTSAAPSPAVSAASLTGVHTQVALDSGFVAALQSLKLTPGVTGSATLTNGTLSFPITSGNAIYYAPGTQPAGEPYVQGMITHEGSGISLTSASGTKVTLENFVVNPGTSMLTGDVLLNGKMAAPAGTELFFLDGRTLKPASKDSSGDYVLAGTEVKVAPGAAALLDKAFSAPMAVPDYLLVGVATITIK